MGESIVVCSGKGGTGKTSFCANVAVSLCALGGQVLLIDADAGLRSLDIVLGMTDKLLFSYEDVLMGRSSLKEAAVPHDIVKNLRVITAPAAMPNLKEMGDAVGAMLKRAKARFSHVIIDCPAGLGQDILTFGEKADRAIIVSTPDETSLRSAHSMAVALAGSNQTNAKIAVNRVRRSMITRGDAVNIDRAMDASGLSLLGVIPEDTHVIANGNRGRIMLLHADTPAVPAYMNIAKRLLGERIPLLQGVRGAY